MKPTTSILSVWARFDNIPMETLTKAWYWSKTEGDRQRSVAKMQANRQSYGCGGNHYDLAIWLIDAYQNAGLKAWAVRRSGGNDVAVIVEEQGNQFFLQQALQWTKPVHIGEKEAAFRSQWLNDVSPGLSIQVDRSKNRLHILWKGQDDTVHTCAYDLTPLDMITLRERAALSQKQLETPLVRVRTNWKGETAMWEFQAFSSRLHTAEGAIQEATAANLDEWVERIHQRTGMDRYVVRKSLSVYRGLESYSEAT